MTNNLITEEVKKLKIPRLINPEARSQVEKASIKISERILAEDIRSFEKGSDVNITLTKEELIWIFWCLHAVLTLSETPD